MEKNVKLVLAVITMGVGSYEVDAFWLYATYLMLVAYFIYFP